MTDDAPGIRRKDVLKAGLVLGSVPAIVGGVAATARGSTPAQRLEATPSCDDGDEPTPPQIEGPYFKPNSPQRTSIIPAGAPGIRLTVQGYVFDRDCRPLPDVLLDFWQCDVNGAYDNVGYRFRGHQFTTGQAAYGLETIVPGLYPGRTRHIHVKVQAPNQAILTTQLYFPGEPRNETDPIFDPRLLMTIRQVGSAQEGTFDFVLDIEGGPGPTPTPDPPGTWATGTSYRVGDQVVHGGRTYRCVQTHTAQSGWEPPNVPALWQPT